MARNIRSDEERRTIIKRARYNEPEVKKLEENMAAAQISDVSKFLRMKSLNEILPKEASKDQKALVQALQNLGAIRTELEKRPETPDSVFTQIEFMANAVHMALKK